MHSVAIVGCGLIATEKYLPIFKQLGKRARIAGICDLDTTILERAAKRFGISETFTDFAELASAKNPDLVVICTPPATHKPLAIQAMLSGANVLIEKPMALSGAECDEMIAVGESEDRKIGVMHNQVFNPAIDKARKAMAKPGFGRLLGVRIFLATSTDYMTSIPDHWAHRLPGGVVGETGPHAVYLSQAFLGEVNAASVWKQKLYPEFTWSIAEDVRMSLTCADGLS